MAGEVTTWHHGLIARWWSNFNRNGPEIDFFRRYVADGQPALDVACGSGRLLVPWVASGLDVDGVDASADMIAACREAARSIGCKPNLFTQPTHMLELPRRYRTAVMCGGLGLGGSRDQDVEGLRRVLAHLEPGGVLALDSEVGEFDDERWRTWQRRDRDEVPPGREDRELAPDGFEYALRHRVLELDLTAGRAVREMQAWQWRDGDLVAYEVHELVENLYSRAGVEALLERAGFVDVEVLGGYHGGPPTGDEEFLVYVASRPTTA